MPFIAEISFQCTWTVHGGTKVFAQTCCAGEINALCRELGEQGRNILVLFNAICAIVCILLVPVVIRERRRNHEARGWALMEIFLFGAAALYSIVCFIKLTKLIIVFEFRKRNNFFERFSNRSLKWKK